MTPDVIEGRTFRRDTSSLRQLEVTPGYYQGYCIICGRRSHRWSRWKHVRMWFEQHKCRGE